MMNNERRQMPNYNHMPSDSEMPSSSQMPSGDQPTDIKPFPAAYSAGRADETAQKIERLQADADKEIADLKRCLIVDTQTIGAKVVEPRAGGGVIPGAVGGGLLGIILWSALIDPYNMFIGLLGGMVVGATWASSGLTPKPTSTSRHSPMQRGRSPGWKACIWTSCKTYVAN